jgi:hypothetical protein
VPTASRLSIAIRYLEELMARLREFGWTLMPESYGVRTWMKRPASDLLTAAVWRWPGQSRISGFRNQGSGHKMGRQGGLCLVFLLDS